MNDHIDNRNEDDRFEDEIELTAAEKSALEKLPRDRRPDDSLEERVVGALHERGLLAPRRRRVIEMTVWRAVAAAAACLVFLAAGFVLGQWTGSHRSPGVDPIIHASDDFSAAASVQQTGSAYLLALQRFANSPGDSDGHQAVQGKEVALTTLCTAADEVTRLIPKDELTGHLLAAIDTETETGGMGEADEVTIEPGQIIEF